MYQPSIQLTKEDIARNIIAWTSIYNRTTSDRHVAPVSAPLIGQQFTLMNGNVTVQPVVVVPTPPVNLVTMSSTTTTQMAFNSPFQAPISILCVDSNSRTNSNKQANHRQLSISKKPVDFIDLTIDDDEVENIPTNNQQGIIRPTPLKRNLWENTIVQSTHESANLTTFHENILSNGRNVMEEAVCFNKTPKKPRLTFHQYHHKLQSTNTMRNSMEKYFKPLSKESKVQILPPELENLTETKPFAMHRDLTPYQQYGELSANSEFNSSQQAEIIELQSGNYHYKTQSERIENQYSVEKDAVHLKTNDYSRVVEMVPIKEEFLELSPNIIELSPHKTVTVDDNEKDEIVPETGNLQKQVILEGECSESRRLSGDMKFVKERELTFLHEHMEDTLFAHIDKKLMIVKHRTFMKFLIDDDKTCVSTDIAQTCFDTLLRKVLSSVDGDKASTKMNVCIRHPTLRYGRKYFEQVTYEKFNGEKLAWQVGYLRRSNPMFDINCDFKIQVDVGIAVETKQHVNKK